MLRRKVVDENGKDMTKKCFWLNSGYIKEIVKSGLSRRYSGQRKL